MSKIIKKIGRRAAPRTYSKVGNVYKDLRQVVNDVTQIKKMVSTQDTRLTNLKYLYSTSDPYQPIYGLKDVGVAQRDSKDRCEAIYDYFQKDVTNLRALDIGCYFGYLSFFLADRGAKVVGWDNNELNIEIANRAKDITGIPVQFQVKEFGDEELEPIKAGNYDVVFILSVLHWIIALRGLEYVQDLMKSVLDSVPMVIVELAQKGEGKELFWDKAVPVNDLDIFAKVGGVKVTKIGDFPTHLSNKKRPIYVVTKNAVEVNGHLYGADELRLKSYTNAPAWRNISSRYYSGKEYFIKEYGFDERHEETTTYLVNEINFFLQNASIHNKTAIEGVPKLVDFMVTKNQAKLVLKKFTGELLCDIAKGCPQDKYPVLAKRLMNIMAGFESNGYYHNDIRSWNVMVNKKYEICVIDMELATTKPYENNAIALIWVLNTLITGKRESSTRNKLNLPDKEAFEPQPELLKIYNAVDKNNNISFADLRKLVSKDKNGK